MKTIAREELKAKLDRGENVKLVMTMSDTAYSWLHIPGSLHFERAADAAKQLNPNDEVVVYCTNPLCYYSIQAYHILREKGFTKVERYAGGLMDWQEAGYPLEGSLATAQAGMVH
jgi:rhodanese-related sulfurtransferase